MGTEKSQDLRISSLKLEEFENTFLFKIPEFYRSKKSREEKLKELFTPILNSQYFKENLEWFVIWKRERLTQEPDLYFLVGEDMKARKVVDMYRSSQWKEKFSKYVMIPSIFCVNYRSEDVSFIFTTKDIEIKDYMKKHLVLINLKKIFTIKRKFSYKSENIEEAVIDELAYYSQKLKKYPTIINSIKLPFKNEINQQDIIKLINCYFWLKLAYPGSWETILYLPGIIEKKVESIPFGVNIGFKKVPSLNTILFLKKITLLFFTRESVDFFEDTAKEEAKKRIEESKKNLKKIEFQSHLLSNFPHITLKYIVDCLNDNLCPKKRNFITNYIKQRGYYLQKIAGEKNAPKSLKGINLCEEIENITKYNLMRKFDDTLWKNTIWKDLFITGCKTCKIKNTNIRIPEQGIGAFYTVIENIIHNSFSRGNNIESDLIGTNLEPRGTNKFKEKFKIRIKCEKTNKHFVFKIGDTTSIITNKDEMVRFFSDDPGTIKEGDIGLGIYSIYCAGEYISAEDKKPKLVFKGKEGCIEDCKYTYIFHFQLET